MSNFLKLESYDSQLAEGYTINDLELKGYWKNEEIKETFSDEELSQNGLLISKVEKISENEYKIVYYPTIAAMILFGKNNPIIAECYHFDSDWRDKDKFQLTNSFRGSVIEIVQQILDVIKFHVESIEIEKHKSERFMFAAYEAVVNAFLHCDYSQWNNFSAPAVSVFLFKDRIEIVNFYSYASNMKCFSNIINPIIFRTLSWTLCKGIGSGIRTIEEICKELGYKEPTYSHDYNLLKVELYFI